jgi:CHAT domain-containing protein/tetratricopeptide (TPR) repeat protein
VETKRAVDALETVPESVYHAEALALRARLKAREEDLETAAPLFCAAAQAADAQGDIALKALFIGQLGYECLKKGRLNEADRAMTEAFRLRLLSHDRDIGQSYRALGLLRIGQGDFESAEVLLERALAAGNEHPGRVPNWADYRARGDLRVAQGRLPDALRDFRHALALARQWRLEILPADSVRLSAGVGLAQLYSSFIRVAGDLYMKTKRKALALEAFEAAEDLRAATLRTANGWDANWRSRLPAGYGQTLAELRAARVKMQREPSRAARDEASRLRQRLTEMEARAGAPASPYDSRDLLQKVSRALAPSEALVSFHLDEPYSYSWTVTRRSFVFRRLAGARQLRQSIREFSGAVRNDAPESIALGEGLYHDLFPRDGGSAESKRDWLLAADGALLEVPFPSLAVGQGRGRPAFLVERHSVTILPAAQLVALRAGTRSGREVSAGGLFLGVGDPIYNSADPRARQGDGRGAAGQLPRLAASDVEIRACARAWRADRAPVLLEGPAATRQSLAGALAQEPAVIHLAAHVIRSADNPPRQLIQLSLLSGGDPDYLGTEDIAAWRLRKPAIVVLSGCASGRGEAQRPVFSTFALPSAAEAPSDSALVGLARAWLAAGARAVVVSHWPTPDDTGELFRSFYDHLHESRGAGVAAALARAQVDMLESKTWRSAPKHWAAYFVIGRN